MIQRLARGETISFGLIERLTRDQVDDTYWNLLPRGKTVLSIEELRELARVFGEDGEFAAVPLN